MISNEEVRHTAKLARIKLTDEEVERFQKDLGDILGYFEIIKNVDVSGVEPMMHSVEVGNVTREDVVAAEDTERVRNMRKAAPELADGYFKVPTILKGK